MVAALVIRITDLLSIPSLVDHIHVITDPAVQAVIAAAGHQHVAPSPAMQQVIPRASVEEILTVCT